MSDEFDDQFAAELLGTHVLAGITRMDRSGRVLKQQQIHGRVVRAIPGEGVYILDADGKEHWLPPHRPSYVPADPGEYRLRSTGEIVVDPDYVTTWTLHPRDRQ